MLVSTSPCVGCAKLIVSKGISDVFFIERYVDKTPLRILRSAGVAVREVKTS